MDPDQGLRYELSGILGWPHVLALLARVHPAARVVALDVAEIALLPVTAGLAATVTPAALCALGLDMLPGGTPHAARRRAELMTGPESGFDVLTVGLVALIEAGSTAGPLAYVEADYTAREGRQAAAVWRSGRLTDGPNLLGRNEPFSNATAPVTTALRGLGVAARGRRDEFVVAGLGRHRRTSAWLEGARP